jgi:hypothetical protein
VSASLGSQAKLRRVLGILSVGLLGISSRTKKYPWDLNPSREVSVSLGISIALGLKTFFGLQKESKKWTRQLRLRVVRPRGYLVLSQTSEAIFSTTPSASTSQ